LIQFASAGTLLRPATNRLIDCLELPGLVRAAVELRTHGRPPAARQGTVTACAKG
jgi:hypothetical protein